MKKKTKKPNLSSEAALGRALDKMSEHILFVKYKKRDCIIRLEDVFTDKIIWQDSLRRLGITKRKPLKGVTKRLRRAVR